MSLKLLFEVGADFVESSSALLRPNPGSACSVIYTALGKVAADFLSSHRAKHLSWLRHVSARLLGRCQIIDNYIVLEEEHRR